MALNQGTKILLKLLPLLLPFALLFAAGIALTIFQSFGFGMGGYHYPSPLFAYRFLFSGSWFVHSFLFSFYAAGVSAVIATALGTILSFWVWSLPAALRPFALMQRIFLILPHIAVAYIVIILFSKTGVLSSLLYQLHLIHSSGQFASPVFSGNGIDVIIGYVFKEVPFVMVLVLGILVKLDKRQTEAARMLGAGNGAVFFKVILPFILPVVNTTFIILFIYSFGAFDLPYVLGDSYPGMLSLKVYDFYFQRDLYYRPVAMAILSLLFLFSIFFVWIYSWLVEKIAGDVRKI